MADGQDEVLIKIATSIGDSLQAVNGLQDSFNKLTEQVQRLADGAAARQAQIDALRSSMEALTVATTKDTEATEKSTAATDANTKAMSDAQKVQQQLEQETIALGVAWGNVITKGLEMAGKAVGDLIMSVPNLVNHISEMNDALY